MSDELLNLSSDLLNEELDVEGHVKNTGAEGASEDTGDDVEAHMLNQNLLNENMLSEDKLDL
jgi:hypothetical protein